VIVAAIDETAARLHTHEEVCAERYGRIELQFEASNARLKRIEMILIGGAGTALLVLLNIAIKMG
jgi:hypothetical protein